MAVVAITIHQANDLPKADNVGKIDPYFRVSYHGGDKFFDLGRTKVVSCDYDPIFGQTFGLETTITSNGVPSNGYFKLVLWDKDKVGKDELVGEVEVQVNQKVYAQRKEIKLAKGFKDRKHHNSNVTVSVGWIASYQVLKSRIASINPSAFFDDAKRIIYVPLGDFLPAQVVLSVEYEGSKVDLKVYETQPYFTKGEFLLELGYSLPNVEYKVRRQVRNGVVDLSNGHTFKYYAETKLDDLPLHLDFSKIIIYCSRYEKIWIANAGDVVGRHGWTGALSYNMAKKTLKNVEFDDKTETVFMLEEWGAFLVDFDKDNVDLSFGIYDFAVAQGMVADMDYTGYPKRTFQYYAHPKKTSKAQVLMTVEIDDIEEQVVFNRFNLSIFKRKEPKTTTFIQHVPLL